MYSLCSSQIRGLLYFNSMLSFLSDILCSDSPCIIVGHFNFPNICWSTLTRNSPLSSAFCEFIFGWNLTQHVMDPTHIKGNILDLILTSDNIQISDLTINPPGPFINSDHFIISFSPNHNTLSPVKNKVRYVFDYSKTDMDSLCSHLLDANFTTCFQSHDAEFVWNVIKLIIYEAMHIYIPKLRLKSRQHPKWFNSDIRHHLNCLFTLRWKLKIHPSDP